MAARQHGIQRYFYALSLTAMLTGTLVENPRDLTKKVTVPMTFTHYLDHMDLLTNQWTTHNYKDPERQRMYLKDIDCPPLWNSKLQTILPSFLYYLNETTGDKGGFGSTDEPDPSGSGFRRGTGIAKAGDLMSCLPKEMRAENMMCYIGHEGTYTPAHREMCASLGHNIMVEASTGLVENGKPTKPGSALWFMTENKEREVVAEYWLSRLGHDIEVETHFAQINAWKSAPFKTWIVEQRPGDLILIPPLAPHQVWNRGTRTMKVAWNRTSVETLEMALNEALPKARMVCRDEQYKNKAMIYYALQRYSGSLKIAAKHKQSRSGSKQKVRSDNKVRQLEKDFRRLHGLFTQLLVAESFLPQQQETCEMVPFEGFVTCSYCRCNIFNRFLTCGSCIIRGGDEEDTYDICLDCYAMGRSCACISKLKWVEQFPWQELTQRHEAWRHQILAHDGKVSDKSPMSLKLELHRMGRKRTLAQICQLELKRRPWRDIKKPPPQPEGVDHAEEVRVDENGVVKKKKKVRRSEKFQKEHAACHIDRHWEPTWKQAACSQCDKRYCYGTLFRAYDMMPQDILADPDWICPSCRSMCSCRYCRNRPDYQPYTPSGTRLGHNTKAVADIRSVESLVDFGFSNISWIQKAGDDTDNTRRLYNRRQEADAAQAQHTQLGEDYVDEDAEGADVEDRLLDLAQQEGIPIDPALVAMNAPTGSPPVEDEDTFDENPEARHETEFGRSLMAPQFVIPEGGILRDYQRSYDRTDAITYDYPDPDMMIPAAVVSADEPEPPSGHGPANVDDDHIEMVSRKRKRNKLDESEKAFIYRKELPNKTTKKKQKSLIVRLTIDKEKLTKLNKTVMLAQRALDGAEAAPAPVVGSDLQALNTNYPRTEGQPPQKKARTEQTVIEQDTEYAPSRRRDRRKSGPDGERSASRDDDVTRRTTRMQATTYEEPSDGEEFDEVVEPKKTPPSKLATMEKAINIDDTDSEDEPADDGPAIPATANSPMEEDGARSIASVSAARLNGEPRSASLELPTAILQPKSSMIQQAVASAALRPSIASSVESNPPAKPANNSALAQAAANRQAKMAALSWAEGDSDSLDEDDDWWDREQETDSPLNPQAASQGNSSSSSSDRSHGAPVVVSDVVSQSIPPASSAIAASSKMNAPSVDQAARPASHSAIVPVMLNKSKLAVTAGDWSDSDSDAPDTAAPAKVTLSKPSTPGSAWTPVNGGGGRGQLGVGAARGRGRGRGRARGRPSMRGMS